LAAIDSNLRIDTVTLAVSDLSRGAEFYTRVLGLPVIAREADRVELGLDAAQPALVLLDIAAPTPLPPGATGLYHVAWLHPSRSALAESMRRVVAGGWMFEGAADHGVSEALYLSDPDGLGIEIYADRPRELWPRPADGDGVSMYTRPLDLEDLLAQFPGEPQATLAQGSTVGHVHLKVADVPRTCAFYRDALGLAQQAQLPSAAFLAADGYHHHVGLNSWQSAGARPAPETAPGLRAVEFELGDELALQALAERLEAHAGGERTVSHGTNEDGGRLSVRDPDGQLLRFRAPRA
jgi:catechol 2,3-dioxygenase